MKNRYVTIVLALTALFLTLACVPETRVQNQKKIWYTYPAEWSKGSICGLKARGGYTVDISWENGEQVQAVIKGMLGVIPQIRVVDLKIDPFTDSRIGFLSK